MSETANQEVVGSPEAGSRLITDDYLDREARRIAGLLDGLLDVIDHEERHPIPFGQKRCSACRSVKPIEAFYRSARSRDGRLGRCVRCFLEKRKEVERELGGGLQANEDRQPKAPVMEAFGL